MTFPPTACLNCGTPLQGAFCHRCGQEDGDLDRSLPRFLGGVFEDVASLDSRSWRTLVPLILRPGEVTAEYLAGRRARYVPPVRLYLFVSLVYFLSLTWLGSADGPGGLQAPVEIQRPTPSQVEGGDPASPPVEDDTSVVGGLSDAGARIAQDPERFRRTLLQGGSYLMFLLLPAFAGLTWLRYQRRRPYYLHHLLHALHLHVVVFLVLGAMALLSLPGHSWLTSMGQLLILVIPVHLTLSLKRVFGGGWWAVILSATAILAIYWLLVIFALLGLVLVLALWF